MAYADKLISPQSPIKALIRDLAMAFSRHNAEVGRLKPAKQVSKVRESGLFDEAWYLNRNQDVASAKINPLLHYIQFGGFEGRDPNSSFSSRSYLATHPHLAARGINPLYHYLLNHPAAAAAENARRTAQPPRKASAPPRKANSPSDAAKGPLPAPGAPIPVPALPWKAIVKHSREAGHVSRVLGVASPRGQAIERFDLIRVDEDIEGDRLLGAAGYLFDVAASDSRFGWEGTMTAANNLANEALVRHLRAVRAAKLPTVLVYDTETLSRPFYKDLQSLFTVQVDRRSLEDDEVLPGPFATLCKGVV